MNFNIPKMVYSKSFQSGQIQPKNIEKKFTSDCIYRNADLNFILVAATTDSFFK